MLNVDKLVAYFTEKGQNPETVRAGGELVNQHFPAATGVVDEAAPINLIYFKSEGHLYYIRLGQLVIHYAAKKNKGNAKFLYNPLTEEVDLHTRLHEGHILWKKRVSKANKKGKKKYGKTREVVVDELIEAVKSGPLLDGGTSNSDSSSDSDDTSGSSLDLDVSEPVRVIRIESKEDLSKFKSTKKKPKLKKKGPPRKKKVKLKSATRSAF